MNDLDYRYADDIKQVAHLRDLSLVEIARGCGLSEKTLRRWVKGDTQPDEASLEAFYEFAFEQQVKLNKIKAQFHEEDYCKRGKRLLFHGSQSKIEGGLSLEKCKPGSDFGRGFYCGESLEHSTMFVSGAKRSSLYIVGFDPKGLRCEEYEVGQDWMLTIAAFRGRLNNHLNNPHIVDLMDRVKSADYVIAPIADNRMYEQISEFIDGLITDVVCEHCLSATQLGKQFVFLTTRALERVELLERCYLSAGEKRFYRRVRQEEVAEAEDKVKAAKRKYRSGGKFIDELMP